MILPVYFGQMGKILFVDLSGGRVSGEALPGDLIDQFGGGIGINVRLIYGGFTPGASPTGPENMIVIGTGVLTNTGIPSTPKAVLTTKGALTGSLLSSPSGEFGNMLKRAGYDHLVITGSSERPVYIEISESGARILPAGDIWGKDIYQTTDDLVKRHGKCSVAAIGPAGENLVKFANVLVNKHATWCRGGIGAVWGSKNLKAVVASGSLQPRVHSPERLKEAVRKWHETFSASPFIEPWRKLGIYIAWKSWVETGKLTVKNWTELYPSGLATRLYGPEAYLREIRRGSYSCPSCPLGCKGIIGAGGPESGEPAIHSTDPFAGSAAFGIRCDVGSLDRVVRCTEMSNRLGLDYATFSMRLEYLVDLYQKGILKDGDCGGYRPGTGYEPAIELMRLIAFNEGIGRRLAGTWKEVVEDIGGGVEELAVQIKGMDPSSDIRGHLCTETLGLLTGAGGGHNMRALGATIVPGRPADSLRRFGRRIGVPEERMEAVFSGPMNYNPARLLKWVEDYNTVLLILGCCNREPLARAFDLESCAGFYRAVTGRDLGGGDLLAMGQRTWDLERLFNFREGFTREDDLPPKKWATESRKWHGDAVLPPFTNQQAAALLEEYYRERDWDPSLGAPAAAEEVHGFI